MNFNVIQLNKTVETLTAEKAVLVKQLETAEADLKDARKYIDEIVEKNGELTKQGEGVQASIDAAKAEAAKTVESTKAEMQAQLDAVKAELETAKTSANKIAAETVASLGIPEGVIKQDVASPMTPQAAVTKFESLSGKERSEFFAKHEAAIIKGYGYKR